MTGNLITTGSIATNRKARFNYAILETYEAGIILTGGEVKSLRAGHATINESYASFEGNGLYLINAHIMEYGAAKGGFVKQVASRPRQLLLRKKELKKIKDEVAKKGKTPAHFNRNARNFQPKREGIHLKRGRIFHAKPNNSYRNLKVFLFPQSGFITYLCGTKIILI